MIGKKIAKRAKMTTNSPLKGVITALVTPFKNGEVDLKSFSRLVQRQLSDGVEGFVINGTTGESPNLTAEEVKALYRVARAEVGSRLPVILGAGTNSTAATVERVREAERLGADAALVVVPYYNRPPQRGLEAHFREAARAANIPILIYNVPGRTSVSLSSETAIRLSEEPNILGLKDATGDMEVLAELRDRVPPGFSMMSGDDVSCVKYCLEGGHGVIAVASHVIGAEMAALVRAARGGDASAADRYQSQFGGFLRELYCESNPIPVKQALYFMGIIDSPELRLPLVSLDKKFHEGLKSCLRQIGKI